MRAEAVAFDCSPGHLQPRRTLVARADSVPPVVIRREVPAWPAQNRHAQLLHGVSHIAAVAIGIRQRRAFVEYSALDAAPQVLDKIAVEFWIDVIDHTLRV